MNDEAMMPVHFTQYLTPDGRRRSAIVLRPTHVAQKAQELLDAGLHLEAEVLSTGEVSFTIASNDEDLAIELAQNGPDVPKAVDKLILEFHVPEGST